jgi:hypothetical protein
VDPCITIRLPLKNIKPPVSMVKTPRFMILHLFGMIGAYLTVRMVSPGGLAELLARVGQPVDRTTSKGGTPPPPQLDPLPEPVDTESKRKAEEDPELIEPKRQARDPGPDGPPGPSGGESIPAVATQLLPLPQQLEASESEKQGKDGISSGRGDGAAAMPEVDSGMTAGEQPYKKAQVHLCADPCIASTTPLPSSRFVPLNPRDLQVL